MHSLNLHFKCSEAGSSVEKPSQLYTTVMVRVRVWMDAALLSAKSKVMFTPFHHLIVSPFIDCN